MASNPYHNRMTRGIMPPSSDLSATQLQILADDYIDSIMRSHGDDLDAEIETGDDELDLSEFATELGKINKSLQTTILNMGAAFKVISRSRAILASLSPSEAHQYQANLAAMDKSLLAMKADITALRGKTLSLGWGLAKFKL